MVLRQKMKVQDGKETRKDRALGQGDNKRKEDKEEKILDLLKKRVSGRTGQTLRETETHRERDDVVLSVFPCGDSTAC